MATRNDITGDELRTKVTSEAYRNNFDAIFRKKKESVLVCPKCGKDRTKEACENLQDCPVQGKAQ